MNVSVPRRIAEVTLGQLVVRRRLPAAAGHAQIVVSGKVGGLKYLMRRAARWDPELLAIAALLIRRGNSVWDVGANVGLFSLAAAFHSGAQGEVLSIEPDVDAVALLNRTCKYQTATHARMTVLPVAVAAHCGFIQFNISKRARASNSIQGFGSSQTGGVEETRTLPCVTLDSMLGHFRHPEVLKIDVEEAELEVLAGAQATLDEVRPVLYLEISARTKFEITQLLKSKDYSVWDGRDFDPDAKSLGVLSTTINVVAIPKEKVSKFSHKND